METKICVYEENDITFLLSKDNGRMINATEMAKAFGKEVARFMENDSTKNSVTACLKTRNSSFLGIEKEEDLFQFTKSDGTKAFIESCLKPANAGLLGVKTSEDLMNDNYDFLVTL